jgi:hypothetical protein
MTTTLYLRAAVWGSGNEHGKWQSGTDDANLAGAANGWIARRFHTARGSSSTTMVATTVAGPTSGLELNSTNHWNSAPLAADVTISGNITLNLWMLEAGATNNAGAQVVIERITKLGQVGATVLNSEKGTELSTTSTLETWTAAPASTAFLKGDRIRVRVAVNDAGGTMAAGSATLNYDGGTPGASGDSFITFNENLTFVTAFPTPTTTIYLTDTASDIDPGGAGTDTKEAWTSRGGSDQTAVANTAAGYTASIQWTKTAGGNLVEWYTKRLNAVTLGGVVLVNFRGLESAATANVSPRAEIAICDAAGAVLTTWGANTVNNELGIASAATIYNIAGDDTVVNDGERLRIRFSLDDMENAPMAAGQTATLGYNGSGVGPGDTYLVFTESLTEYVTAPPKSIKRNVGRPQAAQRASRW